jgi:hypothetical protein
MADEDHDVAKLEASLRSCRLELAAVRVEQERWAEERGHLTHAAERLTALSESLDQHLRQAALGGGVRGWVKRRLLSSLPSGEELTQMTTLLGSDLFDGPWYLREYPDVARTGLSPALHYLRHGAAEGKDPGPRFSTARYLTRHPRLDPARDNPLLHHLSSGR